MKTMLNDTLLIKLDAIPGFYSCKNESCTWIGPQLIYDHGRGVCPSCGSRSLGVHFKEEDVS